MSFGERLNEIMKEKGLNMHKLAVISGVSYNTIYSTIKRNSEQVSYSIVLSLADALGVDPYYLLYGVDPKQIGLAFRKYDSVLKREFKNAEEREKSLMLSFRKLNPDGQQIAVERVEELTEIKKYRKDGEDPHDPGIE